MKEYWINKLQNGEEINSICVTPDEYRYIKKAFGSDNIRINISDFTYISVKPGVIPIID